MSESASLQAEIAEALEELKEVKSASKGLSEEESSGIKCYAQRGHLRHHYPQQQQERQSSWARTTTRRVGVPCRPVYVEREETENTKKDVKTVTLSQNKISNGVTIAKAPRVPVWEKATTAGDCTYDANISALSTKKRARSVTFALPSSRKGRSDKENESRSDPTPSSSNSTPEPHHVLRTSTTPKSYSFGKAPRNATPPVTATTTVSDLDLEKASHVLYERPIGGTFSKESRYKEPKVETTHEENDNGDTAQTNKRAKSQNQASSCEVSDSSIHIDVLSNRSRAPAVKIVAEQTKPRQRLRKDRSDYGTPGPGTYAEVDKAKSFGSDLQKKRSGSFAHSPHNIPYKSRVIMAKNKSRPSPGPGEYFSADISEHSGSQKNESDSKPKSMVAFCSRSSDAKLTPQLAKKSFHKSERNFKQKKLFLQRQAEKAKEGQLSVEACFAKKYDLIEKRSLSAVHMTQQHKAQESTKQKLQKAGITPPQVRLALEQAQNDVFLGPQLQTPWVEALPGKQVNEEDEEVLEAMAIIHRHRPMSKKDRLREEESNAFLRSSHSGVTRRAAVNMHVRVVNKKHQQRHPDLKASPDLEYLPTQLHREWGHLQGVGDIAMERNPGRDSKKVPRKGVVDLLEFNQGIKLQSGGHYEVSEANEEAFGSKVRGGVKFDSMLNRSEVVGPKGERPQVYQQNAIYDDEHFTPPEELILERDVAKEKTMKRAPNVFLYNRDRHSPVEVDKDGDGVHLGGSWFAGMAEEVGKQPATVKYDDQSGRESTRGGKHEEKKLLKDLLDEEEEGGVWDLEVKNWKPHKDRTITAPAWLDPEAHPRFSVEKQPQDDQTDDQRTADPNYQFGKPREGVGVLDMGKQASRWTDASNEAQHVGPEGGDYAMPASNRAEVAKDMDDKLFAAESKQSGRKKEVFLADMDKQSKRQRQSSVKSSAPDVEYDIVEGVTGKEQRRDKGVLDWNKQHGRDLNVIDKNHIIKGNNAEKEEQYMSDEEKLDIDQNPDKTVLSGVKRAVFLPAWSEAKGPSRPPEKTSTNPNLEYNPNTEFGKPKVPEGVSMNKQSGRHDNKTLQEVNAAEFDDREELDIDVDGEVKEKMKFASTGGAAAWHRSGAHDSRRPIEAVEEANYTEELILSPKKSKWEWIHRDNGKHGHTSFSARGSIRGEPLKEEASEELILEPRDNKLESNNVHSKWNRESRQERSGALDHDLEAPEELKLSPTKSKEALTANNANKRSTAWKNTSDRAADGARTSSEEVILDPFVSRSSRQVSSADWGKQSTAVRSGYDTKMAEEEELKLSPKEVRRPQRKASSWKSQSDLGKTAPALDDSEELILSPKEVGTKQPSSSIRATFASVDRRGEESTALAGQSESEELLLSPKAALKRTAIPPAPPAIPQREKLRAAAERRRVAEGVASLDLLLKANNSTDGIDVESNRGDKRSSSVTWKDEVGGSRLLAETSDGVGQASSRHKGDTKQKHKHHRYAEHDEGSFHEELTPPLIKAPTPTGHAPDGFKTKPTGSNKPKNTGAVKRKNVTSKSKRTALDKQLAKMKI